MSFSQPHLLLFAAFGELLPQLVDLALRLTSDEEGDRRREREVRAAVEGDELPSIDLERDRDCALGTVRLAVRMGLTILAFLKMET